MFRAQGRRRKEGRIEEEEEELTTDLEAPTKRTPNSLSLSTFWSRVESSRVGPNFDRTRCRVANFSPLSASVSVCVCRPQRRRRGRERACVFVSVVGLLFLRFFLLLLWKKKKKEKGGRGALTFSFSVSRFSAANSCKSEEDPFPPSASPLSLPSCF